MGKHIKQRTLLEAAYVRKFRFDNMTAFKAYVEKLEEHCIPYEILEVYHMDDHSHVVTIATAYNNAPLMKFT